MNLPKGKSMNERDKFRVRGALERRVEQAQADLSWYGTDDYGRIETLIDTKIALALYDLRRELTSDDRRE